MVSARVMVIACVMVLSHVMVFDRVMALSHNGRGRGSHGLSAQGVRRTKSSRPEVPKSQDFYYYICMYVAVLFKEWNPTSLQSDDTVVI